MINQKLNELLKVENEVLPKGMSDEIKGRNLGRQPNFECVNLQVHKETQIGSLNGIEHAETIPLKQMNESAPSSTESDSGSKHLDQLSHQPTQPPQSLNTQIITHLPDTA